MCLQCFFSITYHSVPSCDCNEAFTENVWTESILSSADVCLPRKTSSSYVFIQPCFLNYASETVQFFRDTHHWSESVGPLGSLPTPRSVIVSVCMCASWRYTLSYNSLRRWMRRQWSGCFVFVFYLIADGASLTVYTKRALLETKTFSCRTLTHTRSVSHPRVKTLSREY